MPLDERSSFTPLSLLTERAESCAFTEPIPHIISRRSRRTSSDGGQESQPARRDLGFGPTGLPRLFLEEADAHCSVAGGCVGGSARLLELRVRAVRLQQCS